MVDLHTCVLTIYTFTHTGMYIKHKCKIALLVEPQRQLSQPNLLQLWWKQMKQLVQLYIVLRGQTLFSRRGVMACSMNPRECTYTTSDNAPARK